jgi:hypothetical protein
MSDIEPRDWYLPRLQALVAEAKAAGFAPDVSVALITSLMNEPPFVSAEGDILDEDWNRDIGEPDEVVNASIDAGVHAGQDPKIGGTIGPGHANAGMPRHKSMHHYGSHGLRRF